MKKNIIIVVFVAILVIGLIVGSIMFFKKGDNEEQPQAAIKIETEQDMKDLIENIYTKVGDQIPNTMTIDVDKEDEFALSSYTGLSNAENIDFIVASEPMMSSQAYSFVLVKVTDGADVDAIKQEMFDNINTRKWICVSAEKLYVTNSGNLICLIMSSSEWADPVYSEFKNIAGGSLGEELTRTEEEV